MPRAVFNRLYGMTVMQEEFAEKLPGDRGRGPPRHRTDMKLLITLRILAGGFDFTVASDIVDMSEKCIERFFKGWCKWVAEDLYPKYVYLAEGEELQEDMGAPTHTCVHACTARHSQSSLHRNAVRARSCVSPLGVPWCVREFGRRAL